MLFLDIFKNVWLNFNISKIFLKIKIKNRVEVIIELKNYFPGSHEKYGFFNRRLEKENTI